jgi:tRNA pseudouridine55 synthase
VQGVLVVDKVRGPTSHDVVAWARKALGTPAIGHAGTLDPMATGVLVLGVGEGTKLTSYLMGQGKTYEATLALGIETDTLDAEGKETERADVPALGLADVDVAARAFVGTYLQRAPVVSAIKRGGMRLHERARRGEDVEAPEREVTCEAIDVVAVREREIDLRLRCASGFYVRALARDLARRLGTRGHLSALRRTRSGTFGVETALPGETLRDAARGDEAAKRTCAGALVDLARACDGLARLDVDEEGERAARHGRAIEHRGAPPSGPIALVARGALIAIGRLDPDGHIRVVRGFSASAPAASVSASSPAASVSPSPSAASVSPSSPAASVSPSPSAASVSPSPPASGKGSGGRT